MRKLLLFVALILSVSAKAQLASFDSLSLPGNDTFYLNTTMSGMDMGFDNGLLHFPYVYDTSFGGMWSGGFSYSNKKDSTTSGFSNQYSAKAGSAFGGSGKYAVFTPGFGPTMFVKTIGSYNWFIPQGIYVTNSTYAYNSMRDGDAFAKKFGGVSGNDTDWFKIEIRGYKNGVLKTNSVQFYLADFRTANNTQDYIVKDWRFVNLTTLGAVDSMYFTLSSSDNGAFGMNTPAYFCLDNLQVAIPINGVGNTPAQTIAKVYPNPATNALFVDLENEMTGNVSVYDVAGRVVSNQIIENGKAQINTSQLTAGIYVLKLETAKGNASMRFTKQ